MPLTPFTGLSVTLHLLVILIHRIFRGISTRLHLKPIVLTASRTSVTLGLSLAVIFCVFFITIVSATTMIVISVSDEHSSLNYAENIYNTFHDDGEIVLIPYALTYSLTTPYFVYQPSQVMDALQQPVIIPNVLTELVLSPYALGHEVSNLQGLNQPVIIPYALQSEIRTMYAYNPSERLVYPPYLRANSPYAAR